jgi:hypothetical protein
MQRAPSASQVNQLHVLTESGRELAGAALVNLSLAGCCIRGIGQRVRVRECLELMIPNPHGESLHLFGVVKWAAGALAGLDFQRLREDQTALLNVLLAQQRWLNPRHL